MTSRVLLLVLGAVGPFLIQMRTAGWSVLHLFRYHSERPIHMESIWGSAMLLARTFGVPCEISHSHGGYNLMGEWEPAWKAVAIALAVASSLALGLWALLRGQRFDRRHGSGLRVPRAGQQHGTFDRVFAAISQLAAADQPALGDEHSAQAMGPLVRLCHFGHRHRRHHELALPVPLLDR